MSKQAKIILICITVVIIGAAVILWPKNKKPGSSKDAVGDQKLDKTYSAGNSSKNTGGSSSYKKIDPVKNLLEVATAPFQIFKSGIESVVDIFSNPQPKLGNDVATHAVPKNLTAIGAVMAGRAANPALFPLHKGSTGNDVKIIQQAVNQSIAKGTIKSPKISVDGVWGSKTDAAVKQIYPTGYISLAQFNSIAARVNSNQGLI